MCTPVLPPPPIPDEKPSAFKWFFSPFTLAAFRIFSSSLILRSVIMLCFGVVVFGFLLWVHAASSICGLKSLAVFGAFQPLFSRSLFSSSFSPSGIRGHKHEGFCFMLRVLRLSSFLSVVRIGSSLFCLQGPWSSDHYFCL